MVLVANSKEPSKEEPVAPVPDPAAHATDNDDEEVEIKHDDVVTKTPQIEAEVQDLNYKPAPDPKPIHG